MDMYNQHGTSQGFTYSLETIQVRMPGGSRGKKSRPALSSVLMSGNILKKTVSPLIIVNPDCDPHLYSNNSLSKRKYTQGNKTFPLRKSAGLINLAKGYDKFKLSFLSLPAEFGDASSDDLSSEWASSETERETEKPSGEAAYKSLLKLQLSPGRPTARAKEGISPSWKKVQRLVKWTPFLQKLEYNSVYRSYYWAHLGGHSGNFKAGIFPGTILKKACRIEEENYKQLAGDTLVTRGFLPKFYRTVAIEEENDEEHFIEMEDCLSSFESTPCIMDCKIGVRTYLEDELQKANVQPKLRKDMYEKMIAVDPTAPTDQEHLQKGVTKCRYMVWRETISSTATLGFRIEGIRKDGHSSKDFKTTCSREEVETHFSSFIAGYPQEAEMYVQRLTTLREALIKSEFFNKHEVIGSSILFVQNEKKTNIWMIDFGKTVAVREIDHNSAWEVGNHEDGYLIGLDNIIELLGQL